MKPSHTPVGDFKCSHCLMIVSGLRLISGVNNRNHCPYCLWSRHLDLHASGDRLSACKAPMRPIGLTIKKSLNKYGHERNGELMLIHECIECQALSINRIAADDVSETMIQVFRASLSLGPEIHAACEAHEIELLESAEIEVLYRQLCGSRIRAPVGPATLSL